MGKYKKVYRIDTDKRDRKINLRLAKDQSQLDRLDNTLEKFEELQFMKQIEFYTPEDIKRQKQFLQKLLLEAEIISINGEPKIRKPALRKSRIHNKVETLEIEVRFWEEAIAKQKEHLEIHAKNKDKKNYKLVQSAIEELEKHLDKAKLKLEGYMQILKFLNKN